jgi:hypothetical protein
MTGHRPAVTVPDSSLNDAPGTIATILRKHSPSRRTRSVAASFSPRLRTESHVVLTPVIAIDVRFDPIPDRAERQSTQGD